MNKQAYLEGVYSESYNNELEKLSSKVSRFQKAKSHIKRNRGKYGIASGIAIAEAMRQRNRNRNIITGSLDKADD